MTKKKDVTLRVQDVRAKIEELLTAERMTGAELMRRGGFSPAALYLNLSKLRQDKVLVQDRQGRNVILGIKGVDYGDDSKPGSTNGKTTAKPVRNSHADVAAHLSFVKGNGADRVIADLSADHVVHAIRSAYGPQRGQQIIKAIAEHLQGTEQSALLLAWLKVA